MADRLDKLIAEVARSTYGAAQPNLSKGQGNLGFNRSGGGSGDGGYPVPGNLDPKERPELEEGEAPLCKSPVMDDPSKDPNKGFSDWGDEMVEAADPKSLPKGIDHLEDLKPDEFLRFLEKYRDLPLKGGLEVSEKVDGSARISFGVEGSKVWTQSKHGDKKYNSAEYPDTGMYRAIKQAHKALESKGMQLSKGVPPGTFFVAEVLYTKIPNSIEYGPNVIMIHGVHQGERDLSDEESRKVAGAAIKAAGSQLSDGKDRWKFEYKRVIDPNDVMVNVKKEFDSLKDVYAELKRLEPDRRKASGKGNYNDQLGQFKAIQIAIKKKLLGQLRKQKSVYGPEGGDVEGLVFRDLESGNMVKLVDKEYFTALNKFLWQYREMLDKGLKVGDKWEFGIMQKFRNAIADEVLGAPIAKTPGFVKMLQGRATDFPPGADTPQKRADVVLAKYIKDEKLMQGDFVKSFRKETEKVHKEFEKLRKEWDAKKKGDLTFSAHGKTVKMDQLIKDRTDESFDGMDQFFKTVFGALDHIGALRGELTKKVGLLKIMMGQQRFEKLVGAVGGQQEESMVHEAAEPGAGDKRLSADEQMNLLNFMMHHYKKLKKRKVDIVGGKRLGAGSNGVALGLKDGRVLKVTYDKSEAMASMAVKGKKFGHIIQISDVFQFPPIKGESNVYGIVQEKLEPLTPEEREEFTDMVVGDVEVESGMFSRIWLLPTWQEIVDNAMEGAAENGKEGQKEKTAHALKVLKDKYKMDLITADLRKAGIKYGDFHGGNIGKRGGEYVVMDLGYSKSKASKVPVMEHLTNAVIDLLEAGPPPIPADVRKEPMSPGGKNIVGVDQAAAEKMLAANKDKLAKKGIQKWSFIRAGTRGSAFDVGGKVLKVTNDGKEAQASFKLNQVGKGMKHVVQIMDVFRFPNTEQQPIYGVIQEKLNELDKKEANLLNFDLWDPEIWGKGTEIPPTIYKSGYDWHKVRELVVQNTQNMARQQKDQEAQKALLEKANQAWKNLTQRFHVGDMVQELSSKGIKFHDYHAGNIMKRDDGQYVVIDIGYSKVEGGKEPPVLEQQSGREHVWATKGPEDIKEQKPSFPDDRQQYVGVHGGVNPAQNGQMEKWADDIEESIVREATDPASDAFGKTLMQAMKAKTGAMKTAKLKEAPADKVGVTIGRYQPFHAGHAAVIRRLAGQFNKVIVLVAGNKLDAKNPFPFETRLDLMKRSLPDVFGKLEIHKAEVGGKSSGFVPGILSDIIKDKKSTVKPDTAIEILVGPDREADVKKQLDRARQYKETGKTEMLFDPDMAIVRGLPGVKNDDDTDRISGTKVRQAIADGDKDAAKKMLDPHLVSNPQQFEELFAKMKEELATNAAGPSEGLDEKLTDVGGIDALKGILLSHADAVMRDKKIDLKKAVQNYMGEGEMGAVFDLGGGKVLKATTSKSEQYSGMKLKGKTFQHITRVYDVFNLSNRRDKNSPITCIIRDDLQKLPDAEFRELNELVDLLRDDSVIHITLQGDFSATMQAVKQLQMKEIRRDLNLQGDAPSDPNIVQGNKRELRAKTLTDQKMAELEARLRHYQIDLMMKDLHSVGVSFADYKGDAIRKRGPNYVLSDFGGGEASGTPAPLLEQLVDEIINEIGITFNTNTPGGTQTGLRAGSSGWSAPMNMYTDDDVEAARENPDEFEVWSDKLARLQNKAIGEK